MDLETGNVDETQEEVRRPRRSSILWGLTLIAVGGLFLVQRLTGEEILHLRSLWPVVFFIIGTGQLLDRRPGSAATLFLLGLWFLSVTFDWYGLTFRNSWPLILLAVGIGTVIKAFSGEEDRRRRVFR